MKFERIEKTKKCKYCPDMVTGGPLKTTCYNCKISRSRKRSLERAREKREQTISDKN